MLSHMIKFIQNQIMLFAKLFLSLTLKFRYLTIISTITFIFVLIYDIFLGVEIKDVIVELHGFLFDLILLGVILLMLEKRQEWKENIQQLMEELDNYRSLEDPSATFEIIKIIKALNKQGITKINLSH